MLSRNLLLSLFPFLVVGLAGCTGSGKSSEEEDGFVTPDGAAVTVHVGEESALTSADSSRRALGAPPPAMELHGGGKSKDKEKDKEKGKHRKDGHSHCDGCSDTYRSRESEAESQKCADALGVSPERIEVVGKRSRISIEASSAVFIKVVGSKARADVQVTADGDKSIEGLCIVAAGDKSQVRVTVSAKVKKLHYSGRGDKGVAVIDVKEKGGVEHGDLDVEGDKSKLIVNGGGNDRCADLDARVTGRCRLEPGAYSEARFVEVLAPLAAAPTW